MRVKRSLISNRTTRNDVIMERNNIFNNIYIYDHLCGLVVRVPGYRSRDPGSIPGAARFSER
jgi:hypothetical protein